MDAVRSSSPHHHGLAHGEVAEMPHVGFEPPRQRVGAADDAVLGNGGEDHDVACLHRAYLSLPYPQAVVVA